MKTTVSAVNAADLADLPPFFDIVNAFFNRCRGDMLPQPHLRMSMDDVCYKIKIDYLAEIIIIRITRDDMFDPRIMQHCHWWCATLKREVRAFGECLGIYRR